MNSINFISLLLKHGGSPNVKSKVGSILHIAISNDSDALINYIIDEVDDFDYATEDENGETALMQLTDLHNINLAIKLLEKLKTKPILIDEKCNSVGGDIDGKKKLQFLYKKYKKKNGILHQLVLKKNQTLIDYLIKNKDVFGIDPADKNEQGLTYLDLKAHLLAEYHGRKKS